MERYHKVVELGVMPLSRPHTCSYVPSQLFFFLKKGGVNREYGGSAIHELGSNHNNKANTPICCLVSATISKKCLFRWKTWRSVITLVTLDTSDKIWKKNGISNSERRTYNEAWTGPTHLVRYRQPNETIEDCHAVSYRIICTSRITTYHVFEKSPLGPCWNIIG